MCWHLFLKNARGCLIKCSDSMIQMVRRAYLFCISGERTHGGESEELSGVCVLVGHHRIKIKRPLGA